MHKLVTTLVCFCAVAGLVAGCGGEDDAFLPGQGGPPGQPPPPDLSKLTLLTSSPQVPSDGASPATLTAQVQDANNNFVPDVLVTFSADSGGLAVDQPITDASGRAIATLQTGGDPTNRVITITASAVDADGSTLSDTVTVSVIGTELSITGPASLVLGATSQYTIRLADANDDGIANETVDVTSSAGNTLSATSLTTDTEGQAQFDLTATVAGTDTLTVQALGLTTERQVAISNDSFAFVVPNPNTEIALNTNQTLTIRWTQAGTPVVGQVIQFSTTRGTLSVFSDTTDANGEVSLTITSANAGAASITATTTDGPTTQLPVEFVATVAATLSLQADPFNIGPNEQSTITAVVRDPNNNLVKNKTVVFELDDVTGGSLSVGASETNSQGRAQTFYTASSSTSASNGVIVTAFVTDDPAVTDSVALTVARRELFFSFGTGNEMFEPTPSDYSLPFTVQVTDADGVGVEGVDVQLALHSTRYLKGVWFADTLADQWVAFSRATCLDEDVNRNGVLDPTEDFNASGQIEAGNIALVTPGTGTSNTQGQIFVDILYPQVYGMWLEVELEAKTDVQGTEFSKRQVFILPVIASDVNSLDKAPPGVLAAPDPDPANDLLNGGLVSPFGYGFNCNDTT